MPSPFQQTPVTTKSVNAMIEQNKPESILMTTEDNKGKKESSQVDVMDVPPPIQYTHTSYVKKNLEDDQFYLDENKEWVLNAMNIPLHKAYTHILPHNKIGCQGDGCGFYYFDVENDEGCLTQVATLVYHFFIHPPSKCMLDTDARVLFSRNDYIVIVPPSEVTTHALYAI